jgi:hypothetical protein
MDQKEMDRKKIYHANSNHKKKGVELISNKTNFKTKSVSREKSFIMIEVWFFV